MTNKERISPAVKRAQQATLKKVRINDLVSVKGGRGLIPWFLKILVLLQVDLSRSWSKVFGSYARRCNKLIQKIGRGNKRVSVVYLSLYLKTCSTLLQQAVGGQKLHSTQNLGCAVARTGKGLPRIIPALHRRKIRQNQAIYIRVWLSVFGLYRILEWVGKEKLTTITAPSTATATWEGYADQLEPFFKNLAQLAPDKFWRAWKGKTKEVNDLLQEDPDGDANPFQESGYWNQFLPPIAYRQIIKSSPLGLPLMGFTSSSLFSQIMAAKTWVGEGGELLKALGDILRINHVSQPPRKVREETMERIKVLVRRPVVSGVIDRKLNPFYSRIAELEKFISDYPELDQERNKLLLAALKKATTETDRSTPSVEYREEWVERLVPWIRVVMKKETEPSFDLMGYLTKLATTQFRLPPPTKILTDLGGVKQLVRPGLDAQDLQKTFHLGKLSTKIEPAGKVRVFALVDLFTQLTLYPLHLLVQDILRRIPQDGTFDQVSPGIALGKLMRESGQKWVASYDLSAATDRLPISLQQVVLQFIVGADYAEAWGRTLVEREYWFQGKPLKYAVGQPMGALSSWVMLAITHHFIVQTAAARAGIRGWFKLYYVLGDDVVIAHREVAKQYLVIMEELGLAINQNKSLISGRGVMEFAKKLYRFDVELTPVSLKELLTTNHSAPVLLETARKYGLSLADLLKLAGYRHHVLGRVCGSFKRLPKRAHTLLVCALSPTGPHAVPFEDWIMLTSIRSSGHSKVTESRVEMLIVQLWRDLLAIAERAEQLRLSEFTPSGPTFGKDPVPEAGNTPFKYIEFSEFLHNIDYDTALFVWNEVIEELALKRRTRLVVLVRQIRNLVNSELSRRFFEIDLKELAVLYGIYTDFRSELMFLIKTPFIQHRPAEKDEPFLAKYKIWAKYGALRPRSGRTSERERTLFLHDRRVARKYGQLWEGVKRPNT